MICQIADKPLVYSSQQDGYLYGCVTKQAFVQFQLLVFCSPDPVAWVLVIDGHVSRPSVAYSILR